MGSKGSQTVSQSGTQNQSYTPNQPIQGLGQTAGSMATTAAGAPFQQPVAPVAPFTPFQSLGFGETLGLQGMAQPYFNTAANYLAGSATPVTGSDVANYYNPMAANVTAQLQNIFGQQDVQNTGNLVQSAGGVGADRVAVGQANMANQQSLAAGQIYSQLYQQALQAAEQNKQMQAGAGFAFGQMGPAAQAAQQNAVNQLLGVGAQQQGLTQQELNAIYQNQLAQIAYPFQTAQYLSGITAGLAPAMGGQTTGNYSGQTTYPSPSPFAQMLGLGTAGLGAYGASGGFGSGSKGSGSPMQFTPATGPGSYGNGNSYPIFYDDGGAVNSDYGDLAKRERYQEYGPEISAAAQGNPVAETFMQDVGYDDGGLVHQVGDVVPLDPFGQNESLQSAFDRLDNRKTLGASGLRAANPLQVDRAKESGVLKIFPSPKGLDDGGGIDPTIGQPAPTSLNIDPTNTGLPFPGAGRVGRSVVPQTQLPTGQGGRSGLYGQQMIMRPPPSMPQGGGGSPMGGMGGQLGQLGQLGGSLGKMLGGLGGGAGASAGAAGPLDLGGAGAADALGVGDIAGGAGDAAALFALVNRGGRIPRMDAGGNPQSPGIYGGPTQGTGMSMPPIPPVEQKPIMPSPMQPPMMPPRPQLGQPGGMGTPPTGQMPPMPPFGQMPSPPPGQTPFGQMPSFQMPDWQQGGFGQQGGQRGLPPQMLQMLQSNPQIMQDLKNNPGLMDMLKRLGFQPPMARGGEAPGTPQDTRSGYLADNARRWQGFESRFPKDAPPQEWIYPPAVGGNKGQISAGGAVGRPNRHWDYLSPMQPQTFDDGGDVTESDKPTFGQMLGDTASQIGRGLTTYKDWMFDQKHDPDTAIIPAEVQSQYPSEGHPDLKDSDRPFENVPSDNEALGYGPGVGRRVGPPEMAGDPDTDRTRPPSEEFIGPREPEGPSQNVWLPKNEGPRPYPAHPMDPNDPNYDPVLDPHNDKYNPNDPRLVGGAYTGPRAPGIGHAVMTSGMRPSDNVEDNRQGQLTGPMGSRNVPFPNATDPNSFARRATSSPWMALVNAGAQMAQTRGPIGSVIGAGLQTGSRTLEGQRQALDSEEAINERAEQLALMADAHLRRYTQMTPSEQATHEETRRYHDIIANLRGSAVWNSERAKLESEPGWMGRSEEDKDVETGRRIAEGRNVQQRGQAPERPPGVPGNAQYSQKSGSWWTPDGKEWGKPEQPTG